MAVPGLYFCLHEYSYSYTTYSYHFNLEKIDHFVDVSVDLASKTVTCLFHQQTESSENYCSIVYGPSRENCKPQNQRKIANRSTSGSNIVLVFPTNDSEHFQPQEEYCFIVTASNGSFTAQIEGNTTIFLGIIIQNMCHGTINYS